MNIVTRRRGRRKSLPHRSTGPWTKKGQSRRTGQL